MVALELQTLALISSRPLDSNGLSCGQITTPMEGLSDLCSALYFEVSICHPSRCSARLPKNRNTRLIFLSPKFHLQVTISKVAREVLQMRNDLLQGTSTFAALLTSSPLEEWLLGSFN